MAIKNKNSYSIMAKEEMLDAKIFERSAKLAFLSALVHSAGSIVLSSTLGISLTTEIEKLVVVATEMFNEFCGEGSVSVNKKANNYTLLVSGAHVEDFLIKAGILKRTSQEMSVIPGIEEALVSKNERCVIAYIKGAFIGGGSVSVKKGYHLEFVFTTRRLGADLCHLISQFDIFPKLTIRKEKCVVYIKDSGHVCDTLALLNASNAVLTLNNAILERDLMASVNRANNCDLHNLDKTVAASIRQCNAINAIIKNVGLDSLDSRLKSTANARIENPEISLDDLARVVGVTKSCIRHRLDKLVQLAEKL